VRSVEAFEASVGPVGSARRDDLRTALLGEFGFIPGYWLVFAASGTLVALHRAFAAPWLGAIAGLLATAGAVCDVHENVHTLQLLRSKAGPEAGRIVRRMRIASELKWTSLLAATGVLAAGYFERGGWLYLLAAAYAAAAGVGAVALLLDLLRVSDRWVDRILFVSLVGTGVVLVVGLPIAAAFA